MLTYDERMARIAADTDAAYDYLMNHQPAYRLLTEAVGLLERRAKRYGNTPEQELRSWREVIFPLWRQRLGSAIGEARADWKRVVGELADSPLGYVNEQAIMRLALAQRDRFDTKEV